MVTSVGAARRVAVALALLAPVGCADDAGPASEEPQPTVTETVTVTETPTVAATDELDDVDDGPVDVAEADPVCPSYLDFVGSRFEDRPVTEAALGAVLAVEAPEQVQEDFATATSPNADIESLFIAAEDLQTWVLGRCLDVYTAGLVPAASDTAALEVLVEAIELGDPDLASTVTPDHVVAALAPWEGYPSGGDADYRIDGAQLSALLQPTVTLFCEAAGGLVVSCVFGE